MSWVPSPSTARHLFYGVLIGFSLSFATTSVALAVRERRREKPSEALTLRPIELRSDEILDGVTGLIGNTPLVRINSLSDALGVEILGKAEYLNPGGSVKDRVALRMIEDAERQGLLHPYTGSRIFEGTVGSTGISIATIARARGYDTTIIMPDDVAIEKVRALEALGADVERVRPASIVDKKQVCRNLAREYALHFTSENTHGAPASALPLHHEHPYTLKHSASSVVVTTAEDPEHDAHRNGNGMANGHADESEELRTKPRGFFADQFENRSNFDAHFDGTGPELWRQTNGEAVALVAGAGTGGTIAGTGQYLKSMNEGVIVALADPEGSGLYNKVKHGVMYDRKESEGTKRRHQVDTVVEGIGINRVTKNIELALPIIDDAFRITDAEAVSMSRFLVQRDGLFLGSSSACNLVACVKLVQKMGWQNGEKVVTILCDSGNRHYSKYSLNPRNDEYLVKAGIPNDIGLVQDLLTKPYPPISSITKI
ncbi:PALP-domain-containing protein [Auriscalpium vulgare]|uniref:PALP-domain-containing protein n=1 Tax=Auriscalpium vulgare TaxID=40419 RepID=A0ACB8RJ25_9AGAM|nr:PALP-domain-containing protein [Auriscalpium vulgare]